MVRQWFSFHVPACFRVGQILLGIVLSVTARGKSLTAFDRPCIPADGVAIRAHTSGMHPNRALSGGRRNGLGARGTFTTDC